MVFGGRHFQLSTASLAAIGWQKQAPAGASFLRRFGGRFAQPLATSAFRFYLGRTSYSN
jgi:hypothetical protein